MQFQQTTSASTLLTALLHRPSKTACNGIATPKLKQSALVAAITHHGLPATFQGFSPDQSAYWTEPGLPFMGICPSTVAELEAFRVTREGQYEIVVPRDDQRMAPRFKGGTVLAARPILRKQNIVPGVYAWQWQEGDKLYGGFGRLKEIQRGRLVMSHDNSIGEVVCYLQWSNPSFQLYRVIGYNSTPVI